jgi:hypothetical protein
MRSPRVWRTSTRACSTARIEHGAHALKDRGAATDANEVSRSHPWMAVAALALAPAALAPAAAAARRQRAAEGACQVSLSVASAHLTAGEPAMLIGSLSCPLPGEAAEQAITIDQRLVGTPGFSMVGSASTEADGAFQFTTAALEANSVFYAAAQGIRSRRQAVKVAPAVTIGGPPPTAALPHAARRASASFEESAVTFAGNVGLVPAGTRVILQRESATANEDWRRIGFGEVQADGSYSISHAFSASGPATVRVVVHARGQLAAASEPLTYEVAQRQSPRLTIAASARPLPYGHTLTISGVAAAAANEPLTLLARARGGAFVAVATTNSDAEGKYEFPAQSPTTSTAYRVRGAGVSSATIFEGVAPQLTAQLSATSLDAGQTLTFSGAIAPGHTGQSVYLERQNPSGVGFHILATATLDEASQFSIARKVFGTGKQVFRIKVPRDAETQAVASELFTVQVQPAPASALEPEAPEAPEAPGEPF